MSRHTLPESFLSVVWSRGLYRAGAMATSVGLPLEVLAPGRLNTDAGPDFREAQIRIGEVTYTGDVELHLEERGWEEHQHGNDPAYNSVILHVVLEASGDRPPSRTATSRPVPLLVLRPFLDPMLEAQAAQLLLDEAPRPAVGLACAGTVDGIGPELLGSLLDRQGIERFELKLRRIEARLHQIACEIPSEGGAPHADRRGRGDSTALLSPQPWEQLLYEGIMEGMGYSKNRTPFLALARALPLLELLRIAERDPDAVEAMLFGAAGLIHRAGDLPGRSLSARAGKLRALWRLLRPSWHGTPLAETDWLFFRLRPANFPTVRLTTMAGLVPLLFGETSFRNMIVAMKETGPAPPDRLHGLRAPFEAPPRLHAARLGPDRVHELLTNTVIPTLLLYARTFGDTTVRAHTIELLRLLPAGQPNCFSLPIERGFPGGRELLSTALRQQGAINLYKHHCVPRRCAECDIGMRLGLLPRGA